MHANNVVHFFLTALGEHSLHAGGVVTEMFASAQ